MSFYISLSGLKGAQTDLSAISNNVANVSSTAFKKSRVNFGDIFAGQTETGQGVRVLGAQQQFTQGTLETTDKTLDVAIAGEGFFTVRSAPPANEVSYTRNGAFSVDENRNVVDTTGARVQVLPTNASGVPTSTATGSLTDLVIPQTYTDVNSNVIQLSNISVSDTGLVSATFADGSVQNLGVLGLAVFPSQEGLRQKGDAHWIATRSSGAPTLGAGNNGLFGSVRSGTLERSNVDITEELVGLISAQRNFQANAKAIETASNMTQAIVNLRT